MQRNFCASVDDEVERGEGACEGVDGVVLGRRGQALAERAGQAQAAERAGQAQAAERAGAGCCSGQAQAVEAAACGGGGREEGEYEYSKGEHPDLFEESMVDEFAGLFQDSDSD